VLPSVVEEVKGRELEAQVIESSTKLHYKQPVEFFTRDFGVRGTLTVTEYLLMFDPDVIDDVHCFLDSHTDGRAVLAVSCHVCIDLRDIVLVSLIDLPIEGSRVFSLQVCVCYTGHEAEYPANRLPVSTVSFKVRLIQLRNHDDEELTMEEQERCAQMMLNVIRSNVEAVPPLDCKSSTFISWAEETQDLHMIEQLDQTEEDSDLKPELDVPSQILTEAMEAAITRRLPKYMQLRKWRLAFSLSTHGCSLNTFYRHLEGTGPCIIVIEDEFHHKFGGVCSEGWRRARMFYGTGDCSLFTFHTGERIEFYPASLSNEYYMMSDDEIIAMGSG
jgi:hypothetical protein